MPRKYTKKPRTYRKKRYVKRNKNTFIKKVKTAVNSFAERKWVDWSLYVANANSDLSVSTTATLINTGMLKSIVNGTNEYSNRIGGEIKLKSIDIKLKCYMGLSTDFNNIVRVCIFQWRNQSSTLTTTAPILYDWASASTGILSGYNPEQAGDFRVLLDKKYTLSQAGDSTKVSRKLTNRLDKIIKFNRITGDVAKGEIFIIAVSDSSSSPNPNLGIDMRCSFTDV